MGRKLQSIIWLAYLLVWAVPAASWAQSILLNDLRAKAEQAVRDKMKPLSATVTPTSRSQPSVSTPLTISGNARASMEDLIEYDQINEFPEHNPNPTVIKKEIAEMLKSATGNVLIIHPFRKAPAVLEKTVSVNSTNTSLEFSVRGHLVGDFLARVVAVPQTGQQDVLYEKTIVGKRGWYAESIDLSRYRGQTVTLRFEGHATGWHFEYVGLDYFFVQVDGNRASNNSGGITVSKDANRRVIITSDFNGTYYHEALRFGFRIMGNEGIATVSNSLRYKVGDVMLRFNPRSTNNFTGEQFCTDGKYHPVTGTLRGDGALDMTIQGCWPTRYTMIRSGDASTASTNSLIQIINEGSISKEQVRRYLRSADIAITGTDAILDGKLSQESTIHGLSWLELFKLFIVADEATKTIASKDYHGAVNKLAIMVIQKQISETLAGSLASSAFAIAKLAALPIELGLKGFADKSIKASINFQIQRYCEIRKLNHLHEFILEGRDDDSDLISFDKQGWIMSVEDVHCATKYNKPCSPPLYYQSKKVFELAKNVWDITQKAEQLQSEKKFLVREFKQLVGNGL